MFDLIQKNIISKVVAYMCTCAILPLLRLVINIANIMIDILKNRQNELSLYLEEGPVLKEPTAPIVLVDIVRCLK